MSTRSFIRINYLRLSILLGHLALEWYVRAEQTARKFQLGYEMIRELEKCVELGKGLYYVCYSFFYMLL